jgi:hypothetical protein
MTRGDESLTFTLPRNIFYDSELRRMLTEFSATGAEQARIAKGMLFFVEHSLKASVFADQAARSFINDLHFISRSLARTARNCARAFETSVRAPGTCTIWDLPDFDSRRG